MAPQSRSLVWGVTPLISEYHRRYSESPHAKNYVDENKAKINFQNWGRSIRGGMHPPHLGVVNWMMISVEGNVTPAAESTKAYPEAVVTTWFPPRGTGKGQGP